MMLQAGVGADTVSYNRGSKACAEAHDGAKAEHWLCMALKAGVEAHTTRHVQRLAM